MQQTGPRLTERHPFVVPQKQLHPQFLLDIAELMAERGLGQVQPHSGFGNAAILGNGADKRKMPDFQCHDVILSYRRTKYKYSSSLWQIV